PAPAGGHPPPPPAQPTATDDPPAKPEPTGPDAPKVHEAPAAPAAPAPVKPAQPAQAPTEKTEETVIVVEVEKEKTVEKQPVVAEPTVGCGNTNDFNSSDFIPFSIAIPAITINSEAGRPIGQDRNTHQTGTDMA
ncbi:hypothetical protein VPJ68_07250, partial [Parabacteroides distasonis]